MGNNTYMNIIGKGFVNIGDGTFNDVLCVPHLSNNHLSVYQVTHSGAGKIVEFTPDSVFIGDLERKEIISTRLVDHSS